LAFCLNKKGQIILHFDNICVEGCRGARATGISGVNVIVKRSNGMNPWKLVVAAAFLGLVWSVPGVRAGEDALDEVNAARAARGLSPYIRDDNLTSGAKNVADFRAKHLIEGHTVNDFAGLPPGVLASASGCAAWAPGMGWGSCCTYERWTYAGAAYSVGRDGRRYMHLFVK
jgi:hypothetical protein